MFQESTHVSGLGPQSAVRCIDAHLIGDLLCSGVTLTDESRDAGDPTASSFQLNNGLHHRFSFNFRPPEMVNPFSW